MYFIWRETVCVAFNMEKLVRYRQWPSYQVVLIHEMLFVSCLLTFSGSSGKSSPWRSEADSSGGNTLSEEAGVNEVDTRAWFWPCRSGLLLAQSGSGWLSNAFSDWELEPLSLDFFLLNRRKKELFFLAGVESWTSPDVGGSCFWTFRPFFFSSLSLPFVAIIGEGRRGSPAFTWIYSPEGEYRGYSHCSMHTCVYIIVWGERQWEINCKL